MPRLRKSLKLRVSNKLAAVSAFLLLITALTGAPTGSEQLAPEHAAANQSAASGIKQAAYSNLDSQPAAQTQRPKRFKVSLMLFPAN